MTKIIIPGVLTLLACLAAGPAARAGDDGAGPVPAESAGGCGGCGEAKTCGEGAKDGESCGGSGTCSSEKPACPDCEKGAAEGRACCAEKIARANVEAAALAVLDADGAAGKVVRAAIPEEDAKKVEAARAEAWKALVAVRRAVEEVQAEKKAICEQAKADGEEAPREMVAACDEDLKALSAKNRKVLEDLAAVVVSVLGEEKARALGAEVRKAGDVAKVVAERVRAEASGSPAEPVEEKAGGCSTGST